MILCLHALAIYIVCLVVGYLLCIAANAAHFSGGRTEGSLLPMTVIRPVRGLDQDFDGNLLSLLEADEESRLQILIVVDSEDDPAYSAALKMVGSHRERDIEMVVAGQPGKRSGKMHAMIEGFKRAKHPIIIFSDDDVRADRKLLLETSRVFAEGADATESPPCYVLGDKTLSSSLIDYVFHCGMIGKALIHRMGGFHFFWGKWMAFRREAIERVGGLESFEQFLPEDMCLGAAVHRAKGKMGLNRCVARVTAARMTLEDSSTRFLRWLVILWRMDPFFYLLLACANPVFLSCVLWVVWPHFEPAPPRLWLLPFCSVVARVVGSWLQDRAAVGETSELWSYGLTPVFDLVLLGHWVVCFFQTNVVVRGKKYRILRDGRLDSGKY